MLNTGVFTLDQLQLGVALVDFNDRWLNVNQAFCTIFGYTREEMLRAKVANVWHGEDAVVFARAKQQLLDGEKEQFSAELRGRRKSGRWIWTELTLLLQPAASGTYPCYFLQVQEITAKKEMELELIKSKEHYKSLYDYNQSGILSCDLSGMIVGVNPAAEKITGFSKSELMNQKVFSFLSFPEDSFKSTIPSGMEVAMVHKTGVTLVVEATDVPIIINGKITGYYIIFKDISDKKMLHEELQRSKQEMKETLQKQLGMTFKYIERNGRFIYTLCEGELVYRLGLRPEEVVGKDLHEIFGDRAESRLDCYRRAWNGEEDVIYEGTVGDFTYFCSLKPVKKQGTVTEVIASCVDISERKKAEISLLETEALYRTLVENALVGVYLFQEEQMIYINPYMADIFGYTQAEMLQLHPSDIVLQGDLHQLIEQTKKTMETQASFFEYKIKGRRKDLSIIQLEGKCSVASHKGEPAILGTIHDVTYKKQVEELLVENANRYQKLIKFLPEPIFVHQNDIIVQTNLSAMKLIKATDGNEVIGKSYLEFVHPDFRKSAKAYAERAMKTDDAIGFNERKIICVNGDVLEAEVASIRIHDVNGGPGILTVIRDITERKRAEELLIRSEKLSAVGQLAAGVAHEIRNPLTALKGFIQLLSTRNKNEASYYQIMQEELERINLIVNDFMSLAKPHFNQFRNGDIKKIIQGVFSIIETQAIMTNVNIIKNFDEDIPQIYCDENQLKQVFMNIVKNAIEAMPQGGDVTISVKLLNAKELLVRICDQGDGIPESILGKIGEPFFTTKEKGTGLGLMICQRIIEIHRGKMQIKSEKGKGTVVDILLPMLDEFPGWEALSASDQEMIGIN